MKTDQVHFEGPVENLLLAVPNRSQKAKGRFCSSQRWHPRPLGCDCLSQWFSNFREPWPPSKLNRRILNISWHLGCACNITANLPSEGLYSWTPENRSVGPVWETLVLSNSRVSKFFGRGPHKSLHNAVRGPDIWSNV